MYWNRRFCLLYPLLVLVQKVKQLVDLAYTCPGLLISIQVSVWEQKMGLYYFCSCGVRVYFFSSQGSYTEPGKSVASQVKQEW